MTLRKPLKDDHLLLAHFLDNPDYQAYPARLEHEHTSTDAMTGEKRIRLNRVTAKKICEGYREYRHPDA